MIAFVLLRVFLILLLVAANAFFAAAEFSLVSVRDTRIQQLISAGRISARIFQSLHQDLDEVVNGVQLGITIVSLTLGWIGEPIVARLVEGIRFVHQIPHGEVYAHTIAIAISFRLHTHSACVCGRGCTQDSGSTTGGAGRPGRGCAHGGIPRYRQAISFLHAEIGRLGPALVWSSSDTPRRSPLS